MGVTRWIDLLAATRRGIATRPAPRWAAVAALAMLAGSIVAGRQEAAERERRRWATTVEVVVVTRDLPAGTVLGPDTVSRRPLPLAVVAPSALTAVPAGAIALHALAEGEIVVAGDVSGGGARSDRLPPGTSGVALDAPAGWTPAVGDPVGVVLAADPVGAFPGPAGGTGTTAPIGGVVVEVGDDGVLVAVADTDVATVAEAAAAGRAVLVLRRAPAPP